MKKKNQVDNKSLSQKTLKKLKEKEKNLLRSSRR
jgi:hypothetical protein